MIGHGIVLAVNISETKGVEKRQIPEGMFIADFGLQGDAHAGKGKRQVSFLAQESVQKMTDRGVKGLCHGKFAENITTKDIQLHTLPVGTRFRVGQAVMEVTQIGKECHDGCAIKQQVGQCIMPKEGIFARVISGGIVRAGDSIDIEE